MRQVMCAVAAVVATAASALGQVVDLRWKFERGQEIRYTFVQKSTTTTEGPAEFAPTNVPRKPVNTPGSSRPGRRVNEPKDAEPPASDDDQRMVQTLGLRMKVVEVGEDGSASVDMIIDSVKVESDGPNGKTSFDSSKPPGKNGDDPEAAGYRAMVGSTTRLNFDKDGNIKSVSVGESLVPAGLAGGLGINGRDLWGAVFTTRATKPSAKVGETWRVSDVLDLSLLGQMAMTTDYALRALKGRNAEIGFKGRIQPSLETGNSIAPFRVRDATYEGVQVWDAEHRQLASIEATKKVMLEGTMKDMPIKSTSTTKLTVTRTGEKK